MEKKKIWIDGIIRYETDEEAAEREKLEAEQPEEEPTADEIMNALLGVSK